MGHDLHKKTPFYRPRNPSASPFFRIVQQYFDDFERIYPEKYERKYGLSASLLLRKDIVLLRRTTKLYYFARSGERSFVRPLISFSNAAT